MRPRLSVLVLLASLAALGACQTSTPDAPGDGHVRSRLAGRVTAPDSLAGPYTFIVGNETARGVDTLGFAMTDASGAYAMHVDAPARGVYPLFVELSLIHI